MKNSSLNVLAKDYRDRENTYRMVAKYLIHSAYVPLEIHLASLYTVCVRHIDFLTAFSF